MNNDAEGSWKKSTPDGNFLHFDGQGNATLNIPKDLLIQVGGNLSINVGENQTINISMNSTETVGMNSTETVGVMKMTSVIGNASTFITGKLTEIIEGDVHSETKKGKTVINNDAGVETFSSSSITKHAQNEVRNNSAEKNKSH